MTGGNGVTMKDLPYTTTHSALTRIAYRAWLRRFLKPRGYRPERKS
jgi:hypothetical protein